MADVLMLFLAALVALGGVTSLGIIVAAGQRQRQIKARNRPAALQRELDELGVRDERPDLRQVAV
jgi:hypothetical protein